MEVRKDLRLRCRRGDEEQHRDGHLDLFVLGGSAGFDRLFLNDGQGNFTDVSVAAGVCLYESVRRRILAKRAALR